MSQLSDSQLIAQTLQGDPGAFDQLVLRHQDRLVHSLQLALGSREDALEVAQLAFIHAWKHLDSFRSEARFYSWVYRIARNAAVSRSRRRRVHTMSLDAIADAGGHEPADRDATRQPTYGLELNEQQAAVQIALQKLPQEFRQPLVLKEIDELTYEEIASIMEIPVGTVRSRIFRARQELAAHLRREYRDEPPGGGH